MLFRSAVILDFFAGSGTTAHATIALNRKDGGKRKFIIAEMGEYFDAVVLRRIKKVVYSPHWKNGKPAENGNGTLLPDEAAARAPRLVKYHRLESYDDALENIEFKGENPLAMGGERYMWEWESKDNIIFAPPDKLQTPFDFRLKQAGKKQTAAADLPETFNLMAGMRLRARRVAHSGKNRYQFDIGILGGKKTICVWRDIGENWQDADFAKDRAFIQEKLGIIRKEFADFAAAEVLANGLVSGLEGGFKSLDPQFIKLMLGKE